MITPETRVNRWFRHWVLFPVVALGLVSLLLAQGQPQAQKKPRIDPAGINGALLLCGNGIPQAAMEQFITLAGGKKARIVVMHQAGAKNGPGSSAQPDQYLKSELDKKNLAELTVIDPGADEGTTKNGKDLTTLLSATGIWICGDEPAKPGQVVPMDAIHKLLKGGGILACSGTGATLLGSFGINGQKSLDLLPDSVITIATAKQKGNSPVATFLKDHPGLVGYEIDPNAALLVQGRKIFSLGEGKVTIHLPACSFRPAKQLTLQGKNNLADLTALRNAALCRIEPEFPPKKLAPPVVEKGTLVIVGGGGMPKGLILKFVELAGGKEAKIVVLPTAIPDPLPVSDTITEAFKKAGARKVTYLKARKLHEVESKETLDVLGEATGLWFGGGRQWGFVDAYLGTRAEPLMHEVLARGGVIGGSSAGASIQGEYMARGDPLGNLNIIAEGYEKGLGFLKGVAIDQHFSQRKRHADMTLLIKTYPQLLGIGIDEATALIVQGHVAEVVGNGKAFFYDGKRVVKEGEPDYEAVAAGGSYDLKGRKVLKQGHPK